MLLPHFNVWDPFWAFHSCTIVLLWGHFLKRVILVSKKCVSRGSFLRRTRIWHPFCTMRHLYQDMRHFNQDTPWWKPSFFWVLIPYLCADFWNGKKTKGGTLGNRNFVPGVNERGWRGVRRILKSSSVIFINGKIKFENLHIDKR